jgi:hypothetical protein
MQATHGPFPSGYSGTPNRVHMLSLGGLQGEWVAQTDARSTVRHYKIFLTPFVFLLRFLKMKMIKLIITHLV